MADHMSPRSVPTQENTTEKKADLGGIGTRYPNSRNSKIKNEVLYSCAILNSYHRLTTGNNIANL